MHTFTDSSPIVFHDFHLLQQILDKRHRPDQNLQLILLPLLLLPSRPRFPSLPLDILFTPTTTTTLLVIIVSIFRSSIRVVMMFLGSIIDRYDGPEHSERVINLRPPHFLDNRVIKLSLCLSSSARVGFPGIKLRWWGCWCWCWSIWGRDRRGRSSSSSSSSSRRWGTCSVGTRRRRGNVHMMLSWSQLWE